MLSATTGPVHAGPASESYEITTSVMSAGGGRAGSVSYGLEAVVSQPTPLPALEPVTTSESYGLIPGFLATVGSGGACGEFDSEPDGDVDGIDLHMLAISDPSAMAVENFARIFGAEHCLQVPEEEDGYY